MSFGFISYIQVKELYKNMKKKLIVLFAFLSIITSKALGQNVNWFGKSTIKSVVLLQKFEKGRFINHGVGILTSHDDYDLPIIVSCEHVLRNDHIYVVVNADSSFLQDMIRLQKSSFQIGEVNWQIEGSLLRTKVNLIENKTFYKHPNKLDIAAFPLKIADNYKTNGVIKPFTQTAYIDENHSKADGIINLGEEIYFIGFPFGIGAGERLEPLLRSGTISWQSLTAPFFLLDAISYGGNSGSPVFSKMSPLTKQRSTPYFIGMVTGHLGKEKENYGLASCVYYRDIEIVINLIKSNM